MSEPTPSPPVPRAAHRPSLLVIGICSFLAALAIGLAIWERYHRPEPIPPWSPLDLSIEPVLPEGAREILENATVLELNSLEPNAQLRSVDDGPILFDHEVLGKITVKRTDAVGKRILEAWSKAFVKGHGAKCFDPRHSIHAEHSGAKLDLVICFECGWVYVYLNGNQELVARLYVDKAAQPRFDELLREAKIPLAKQHE